MHDIQRRKRAAVCCSSVSDRDQSAKAMQGAVLAVTHRYFQGLLQPRRDKVCKKNVMIKKLQ